MSLRRLLAQKNPRALPVGRGVPFRGPVRGRPRPPISIGRPVRPMPIDRPVRGIDPRLRPITSGRPRPIAIGRPVAPPSGIRPLPIQPPSIGRPQPPISIGGPGGGVGTGLPTDDPILQPPADDPFLRPRVDPIARQEPIPFVGDPSGGIVRPLPVGPSIPFTPPTDTNELPVAKPLPALPPPPKQMEQLPFIQQLIPERLGSGPGGNDADRFRRPQPPISIGGPRGGMDDGGGEVGTGLPIDAPIQGPTFIDRGGVVRPLPVGPSIPFTPPPRPNLSDKLARPPVGPDGKVMPAEDFDVGFKADRPDPRDFAKQLPGGGTIYDQLADLGEPIPQGPGVAPPPGFLSNIPSGGIQGAINQGVDFGDIATEVGAGGFDRLNPPITTPDTVTGTTTGATDPTVAETGTGATDPTVPETGTGATDPTTTATGTGGTDPAQTQMAQGAIDPVLLNQQASEVIGDPLLRSLYFGTADQPGFFNQLQQAGANLIGSDVPLQQTAGLSPLELLARQQAVAGLGGFEPFFQQNKDLIDQAIGQSRRAEALRDPYFQRAEQQMLLGLGDQLGGIDQARGITLGATDRFGRALGRLGRQQIGATGAFGQRMGDIEAGAIGAADIFGRDLGATQAGLAGQVDEFGRRLGSVEGIQAGATDQFGRRLSDVEARGEGAAGRFGQALGGIEAGAIGSTDMFGRRLGESEDLLRRTLGGYDQGLTQQFFNPFEDAVVQQTIDDVLESGEQQDIAARAREIGSGAFGGSRARLGAKERREALGEGLAQALGNIRQRGFSEAQRTGLSEFARQRAAERAASQGLSGLAGTRFGAESGLFDRLTSGAQQRLAAEQGVVDLLGRTGQQQLGAQQALANALQGTAGQRFGAGQTLAEFQRGTAGQQLASQQALQNLLQSSAGQQLGAQQQLGGLLRGLTGDQFSAQQQLAANLMGYGSAGAGARQNLASGLLGIGQQRGAGAQQLAQSLAGFGQQIGGIGSQLDALRRGQRSELAGFGGIGRGIAETGLSRLFAQQMAQQQRPLNVLGAIAGMLPGYQGSRTQIDSQYGMPTDPTAAGLGAAFSAYGALAPRQGSA